MEPTAPQSLCRGATALVARGPGLVLLHPCPCARGCALEPLLPAAREGQTGAGGRSRVGGLPRACCILARPWLPRGHPAGGVDGCPRTSLPEMGAAPGPCGMRRSQAGGSSGGDTLSHSGPGLGAERGGGLRPLSSEAALRAASAPGRPSAACPASSSGAICPRLSQSGCCWRSPPAAWGSEQEMGPAACAACGARVSPAAALAGPSWPAPCAGGALALCRGGGGRLYRPRAEVASRPLPQYGLGEGAGMHSPP